MKQFFTRSLLLLSVILFTNMSANAKAGYFGLNIGGVEVTNDNTTVTEAPNGKDVIFWLSSTDFPAITKGKVYMYYNAEEGRVDTLYLDNCNIAVEAGKNKLGIRNESITDLKIKVIGQCEILTTNQACIQADVNTTICAGYENDGHKLTTRSQQECAVYVNQGVTLTISHLRAQFRGGTYGVQGKNDSWNVTTYFKMEYSYAEFIGEGKSCISGRDNLKTKLGFTEVLDSTEFREWDNTGNKDKIENFKYARVTNSYGIGIGSYFTVNDYTYTPQSGKVTFDPRTQTLTLNNSTITNKIIVDDIDYRIKLIGENYVTEGMYIYSSCDIEGRGSDKLTTENFYIGNTGENPILNIKNAHIQVNEEILLNGELNIRSSNLEAKEITAGVASQACFSCSRKLTIGNSSVHCTDGTIKLLGEINLLGRCEIVSPRGAKIKEHNYEGKTVYSIMQDSDFVTSVVISNQPLRYIDSKVSTFDLTEEDDVDLILLNREFNEGDWLPLCVPFDLSKAQIKATFGEGTQVAKHTGWKDNDYSKFAFTTVEEMEAEEPYLIKPGKTVIDPRFYNVDIRLSRSLKVNDLRMSQSAKSGSNGSFGGSYNTGILNQMTGYNMYYIFEDLTNGNAMDSKYLTGTAPVLISKKNKVEIYIDGVSASAMAGVPVVEAEADKNAPKAIYDLNGRRVSEPRRGVYVVDGKKVMFW